MLEQSDGRTALRRRLYLDREDGDRECQQTYDDTIARLATSAAVAAPEISLEGDDAMKAVLDGYRRALEDGFRAFVLEERHG